MVSPVKGQVLYMWRWWTESPPPTTPNTHILSNRYLDASACASETAMPKTTKHDFRMLCVRIRDDDWKCESSYRRHTLTPIHRVSPYRADIKWAPLSGTFGHFLRNIWSNVCMSILTQQRLDELDVCVCYVLYSKNDASVVSKMDSMYSRMLSKRIFYPLLCSSSSI